MASKASTQVCGIGNAIVDVVARTSDDFIAAQSLAKGAMTLIDAERAEDLYKQIGPAVEISGGSAANTLVGIASLGGSARFIGKVRDDQLGKIFHHDITAAKIGFDTAAATEGPSTARCLVLVTPDGQRTMNTYLGACVGLTADDVVASEVQEAQVTYLEGYLFDPPAAQEAFRKASRLAHEAGREVALSLSDPFCVDRHREAFRDLVADHIDILFANEAEILSLAETDNLASAMTAIGDKVKVAVVTRSEKGAVVRSNGALVEVPAAPVEKVVDTTGAGDLFAAGFLCGYCSGRDHSDSARIGALAAAEVIGHYGARPETKLSELIAQRLG